MTDHGELMEARLDAYIKARASKDVQVYTVRHLLAQEFPPDRWIAESILPEGLTLLVSPPKTGKSWLMLAATMAVCCGGPVLGKYKSRVGSVLYLDLEQPMKRTQRRVKAMMERSHTDMPDGLHFANSWPKIKDGGIEHLGEWLAMSPDTRLVVVDTVAKIWPDSPGNSSRQNAYYAEYDQLSQLKRIADDAGIAIVLLHHQNKTTPTDPLDRISGSSAFPGVADTIWLLERQRDQRDATLFVTGREARERKLAMHFDGLTLQWQVHHDPLEASGGGEDYP